MTRAGHLPPAQPVPSPAEPPRDCVTRVPSGSRRGRVPECWGFAAGAGVPATRPLPTPCQAVRVAAGPDWRILETVYVPAAPVSRPPATSARIVTGTDM